MPAPSLGFSASESEAATVRPSFPKYAPIVYIHPDPRQVTIENPARLSVSDPLSPKLLVGHYGAPSRKDANTRTTPPA